MNEEVPPEALEAILTGVILHALIAHDGIGLPEAAVEKAHRTAKLAAAKIGEILNGEAGS